MGSIHVEVPESVLVGSGQTREAFVEEAKEPQGTFFLPISEHGSDAVRILRSSSEAIFLEGADVETTLKAANKEVNALFE